MNAFLKGSVFQLNHLKCFYFVYIFVMVYSDILISKILTVLLAGQQWIVYSENTTRLVKKADALIYFLPLF